MSDTTRRPLHQRSDSDTNIRAGIRLVPPESPLLLGHEDLEDDKIYSRTPLPTHSTHVLSLGKSHSQVQAANQGSHGLDREFQETTKSQQPTGSTASPVSTTHMATQIAHSSTGSPLTKRNPLPKKRLVVRVGDNQKTFSLIPQDESQPVEGEHSLSTQSSFASLRSTETRSNFIASCVQELSSSELAALTTSTPKIKQSVAADPTANSPWNYQFVGGLRKVPKTPDLKQKAAATDSGLPPLPETSAVPTRTLHDLSTKPSLQSVDSVTTTSGNTNYKVYRDPPSEAEENPRSSSDSGQQLVRELSLTPSSVIHRPPTSDSENENYEIHNDSLPSTSYINLSHPAQYSQESLVVRPLNTKSRRPNDNWGYYKQRSRESLRTGSLTSISTVLSQLEASRAIFGTGSLITLPIPSQSRSRSSSWVDSSGSHPQRSHMQESPHQWSSQLSTVLSVSEGGTERDSRAWSDDNGRSSAGIPSSQSRHSRQMLSIGSSALEEEDIRPGSEPFEPPQPAYARNIQRHLSDSSARVVGDQDEYGDGITAMQNLRARPSWTRLSGYLSISDDGRSNTMRSTSSSRANSLVANSIPKWARLYYGSGERKYLGAPGSSTEGESRSNSLLSVSGSPSTDHFPLAIYSPRRRPREGQAQVGRDSLEVVPAPQYGRDGQLLDPYAHRFKRWSASSMWSPHLRLDRRATRRNSMWDPPSMNWSTEGSWFGRRNVQIVMFIVGFIFPFAWMIAAFLPLPPDPDLNNIRGKDHSRSNLGITSSDDVPIDFARRFGPVDEARYKSARWWRGLNRWMSLVGVLILAAIIALIVIGTREKW